MKEAAEIRRTKSKEKKEYRYIDRKERGMKTTHSASSIFVNVVPTWEKYCQVIALEKSCVSSSSSSIICSNVSRSIGGASSSSSSASFASGSGADLAGVDDDSSRVVGACDTDEAAAVAPLDVLCVR